MRVILRAAAIAFLALVICLTATWASAGLWYRLPFPEPARVFGAVVFAILAVSAIAALFTRWRTRTTLVYTLAFALVCFWWSTIEPPSKADWAPDVARQVTGALDGNLLTLTNVRDFAWRSETDFTERWETRSYDLEKLQGLDLFMSYWAGPEMAHMILSFGFANGEQIAWSVEVRRRAGGEFSPLADLFKSNPLVIVAADERDVVGVRSNVRGEDVQIYRLRASSEAARRLLLEYVADANALSRKPQFYNSLTTNCTTTVVKMMRSVGDVVPLDWRLFVNGYLPNYAYDRKAVDTGHSMEELRALAQIDARAKADGLSPNYSNAIRVGVPQPKQHF